MTRREPAGSGTPDEIAARERAGGFLRELLADVQRSDPAPPRGLLRRTPGEPDEAEPARARRGAVVGVLALGMVSLGGVAAASTSGPLHDLGAAVRSAAGAITGAQEPTPDVARPSQDGGRPASPAARPVSSASKGAPVGQGLSSSARGAADGAQLAREVRGLLRAAAACLDAGQPGLAGTPLTRADLLLAARPELPGGPALHRWAAALRARLDSAGAAGPDRGLPTDVSTDGGAVPDTAGHRAPAADSAPGRSATPPAPRSTPSPRAEAPSHRPTGSPAPRQGTKASATAAPRRPSGTAGTPAGRSDAVRPAAPTGRAGTIGTGGPGRGGG
jgi:hypothetical protein